MHKCIGADQTNWLKWLKMITKTKWWVNILFEHFNISFVFLLCDLSMFCILPTLYICFWTYWRNSRLEFLHPPNIFKFTMSTLSVRSPPVIIFPCLSCIWRYNHYFSVPKPQDINDAVLQTLLYISTSCVVSYLSLCCFCLIHSLIYSPHHQILLVHFALQALCLL